MAKQTYSVRGIVVSKSTGTGAPGLRVEAWDKDLLFDDLLGSAITDAGGRFLIDFRPDAYREICFDRRPDVFFRVYKGETILASTEHLVLWNVNRAEIEVSIPVDLPLAEGFLVQGLVRQSDGRAVVEATVKALDKRLRSEVALGEATTDAQGAYRIRYSGGTIADGDGALAGLIVRAYDADGNELAASEVIFHPDPEETLDLVVGNAAYRGPSEYERLVATLTPLLEGLSFADLTEDDAHRDISLLSGRSGEAPLLITMLAAAHRLARRTELAPEVFYGLLRSDLPPNLSALLGQDAGVVRRALEQAAADNLIPARFAEGIDALLVRFRELAVTEAVRPPEDGEQQPALVTLIGTVLADRDRQATFIRRYVEHSGPIEAFWDGLRDEPELAAHVDSLQFALQTGALSGNHLPLVRELQRMREDGEDVGGSSHRIETFRDLVYVDEPKWREIIQRDTAEGRIGVPAGTPGKDEEEQTRQYARTLSRIVEGSFPTAYVAARMEETRGDALDPVLDFLKANVDTFEIHGARLETFLAEHPDAIQRVTEDDRPQLKQRLRAMQRVYRVAPRYEAMSALLKDGIDSAYAIVDMGREQFALRYGLHSPLDSMQTAYSVFARAEQTHAMALALASDHGMSSMRFSMQALPDKRATSDASIPDWQTLFGSLELCECEHCRSVYSPAAYLVDLLHFLCGRELIDPKKIRRDKYNYIESWESLRTSTGKKLTAKDVLFQRRADLGRIELTCANTNTPLPYVDVVNEALEEYIAVPPTFAAFDLTTVSTTELDERKVSQQLRGAFGGALSRGDVLCDSPTLEVVKSGEHWRLHDCAYSYDIQLVKGIPRVQTRGRQTSGSQQELAANPQYLSPAAYAKLRERVFPLTLPFDLWDAEARTYLEHLGVKRHRLMDAFLPPASRDERSVGDNNAIARAHLGLTPADADLITGTTKGQSGSQTPGVWNLWGFDKAILDATSTIPDPADSTAWIGAGEAWLSALTGRVDVFLQQSGLAHKEFLGLLGTYFVNPLLIRDKQQIKVTARQEAPEDTCETAQLGLHGMDPAAAMRAMRFIRLWRKLGWNMRDLDRALTALGVNAADNTATPKIALGTTGEAPIDDALLTKLSDIQWLHEQLGIAVDRLLPFWGKIDCDHYIDHDSPGQPFFPTLYERLFRNKQVINPPDPAFTQDPADLDLDTRIKLAAHRGTIASALGLGAAELDLLLDAPTVLPQLGATATADASLALANLSALYRHATLAKALGLSARSYLIAVKLAFDPFADPAQTVRFVRLVRTLSASDLTLVELDYLSCHQILESDRAAPTAAEIGRELEALRNELQRIAAEHRFVTDKSAPGGPTVDPDGTITRSKLALLGWKAELIDELIGTLNDAMIYRVKLAPPGQTKAKDFAKTVAALNDDPGFYEVALASVPQSVTIPLDSENQPLVTHANGKLAASRRLSPEERSRLRQAVGKEASVKLAVNELIDLQDGYLTTISYDQARKELCFTGVMRKAWKAALLSSPPAPTNDATFQAHFQTAVDNLYKAPRTFFDNAVMQAKDVFPTAAELFDEPKTPGQRFELLLQTTEAEPGKSKRKGLLEHLRDTLSRRAVVKILAEALSLETETAGDLLETWLDSPSQQSIALLNVFLDKAFVESDSTSSIFAQGFKDQFDAYLLLHKSALVLSRFECTPRQARWLFTYGADAKWPDLNALPIKEPENPASGLESWGRLEELFGFRDGMARGEEMLDELLALASAVTTNPTERDTAKTAYIAALHKWTQWPVADLETLLGDKEDGTALGHIEATFPDDYAGAALLARLKGCFALLERTGLSAAAAVKLSADKLDQAAARAAKEAARSKYDETQWLTIAPPLRNALRERQRAALVGYLLSHPDKDHPWRKISDVYGYFLLDVEMSPCQLTSRIKQAISSVQLFIQRCLMGLESKVLATAETDNRWREWRWLKSYRVWEANRKIFLYPENWIEPELRDDKTPFFKALEAELLQTNLTNDTAATAFRGYLDKLDAVARLDVVGMYHHKGTFSGQVSVDNLHVFGRTAGMPHQYYYRRHVKGRSWTAWEKVDLDISGGGRLEADDKVGGGAGSELIPDHLIPVVWMDRLFLIWPMFTEEAEPQTSEPK